MSDEKVALITGVSSGIGAACLRLYKEKGYFVIGLDRQGVHSSIDQLHILDLASADAIEEVMTEVAAKHDKIHVLVNCAGVHHFKNIEHTTTKEYDNVMAVNARAPWILSKLCRPMLIAAKGAIVNVGSVNVGQTTPKRSPYVASKGALQALTVQLAVELGVDGVRVNAVQPGAIRTNMMFTHLMYENPSTEDIEARLQKLGQSCGVLGRMGQPEDIVEAIYFLGDNDQSSFTTGSILPVDGGLLARLCLV